MCTYMCSYLQATQLFVLCITIPICFTYANTSDLDSVRELNQTSRCLLQVGCANGRRSMHIHPRAAPLSIYGCDTCTGGWRLSDMHKARAIVLSSSVRRAVCDIQQEQEVSD